MRRLIPLFATLLALMVLGSDSPKGYDDQARDAGIEGVWLLVRVEVGGIGQVEEPGQFYTYRDGKFCWAGKEDFTGTYTVDTRYRPARLTERTTITQGTFRCIFQIDRDTLRVGYLRTGSDKYPSDFRDRENLVVEVYRRVR
jgi:uncharacterized protein (TIGR03067 family)